MKTKQKHSSIAPILLAFAVMIVQLPAARAQGTAFTYQGELNRSGILANGSYDMTFGLFSTSSGAGQLGNTVTNTGMLVSNGLFTTSLDFGTNFSGADRWLEIAVQTSGDGSFTTLSPRQKLTPTPYALFANTASNLSGTVPLADLPASVALLNDYGIQNIFVGDGAGNPALTGMQNSGTGYGALAADTSGTDNTADGFLALGDNTTGDGNTALGHQALSANTSGSWNTATGRYALLSNSTGAGNTADGIGVLEYNTTGGYNAALGYGALVFNVSGSYNVANGESALGANTTGSYNTANGYEALSANYNGFNNTADGASALSSVTSGSYNIALGQYAGTTIVTGNNNIDIGNTGYGDESSTIRIGTSQTKAVMSGIYGATIASGGTPVYVNSSGLLGTITSSRRFKQNIQSMADASDVLLALHPVTFQYKKDLDPTGTPQFGLVAEDVEKVDPALVVHDDKHQIYSVRYEAVNAMLLNEFLKQHGKVEEQSSEIETLQKQNGSLTERLDELEAAIKSLAEKK